MTDAHSSPVRVGLLSPDGWGARYLEAMAGSSCLVIAGVCSRSPERAARAAARVGAGAYGSLEELLEDDTIEAVLLPTPHFLHFAQARAALLTNRHVFVEKPLANRLAEAHELRDLAAARGLVLGVGLQGRRTAGVRAAKALLDAGTHGRAGLVTVIHGSPQVHQTYRAGDWETSEDTMPGGILDQLGVHYADVLRYLFGPVRRVAGFVTRAVSTFPTIDCAGASYQFDDGVVAVHAVHQVSAYVSELRIFTDRGVITVSRMGRELAWEPIADLTAAKAGGTARQVIPLSGPEMTTSAIREQLEEFAVCVRTGRAPEVGAAEGIAALQVVRAVMQSHDSGRAVDPREAAD